MTDICDVCVHKNVCKHADMFETYKKYIDDLLATNDLGECGSFIHFKLSIDCDLFEATTFSQMLKKSYTDGANMWPSANLK